MVVLQLRGRREQRLLERETLEVLDEYLGLPEMHFLEACIDCGACAPSCPFYRAVGREYSPVGKAEWMRRLYRAVATLSGRVLGRLVGAWLPEGEDDLEALLDAAYHCSNCGACYYTCPHGVDSGIVINMLRSVLFRHGLVPETINVMARLELRIIESPWRDLQYEWERAVELLKSKHDVKPLGRGDHLLLLDVFNLLVNMEVVDAYLDVLDAAGIEYSLPDRPLGLKPPLPLVVGHYESARRVATFVYNYALGRGHRSLVVIDGGYTFNDLKYAYTYYRAKKPRELEIVHVTQLIHDRYLHEGLPPFTQWGRAAYIPSCNIDTRGGVYAGAKLVEATARPYDKHLMWPYAGAGWLTLMCPRVRDGLSRVLGIDLVAPASEVEEKLVSHMRMVGKLLAEEAARTSTGYHVFSCVDDIIIVEASGAVEANPVHLAEWLRAHLPSHGPASLRS